MRCRLMWLAIVVVSVSGCSRQAPPPAAGSAASLATRAANRAVAADLPLAEAQDFEDARRGFVANWDEPLVIKRADGTTVWDFASFGFIDGDAPDTVNPSLWRQARLNGQHGLFEVVPGVHQVRGYDISNMTLIEGKSGWIIVDPLTVEETAAASLCGLGKSAPNPVLTTVQYFKREYEAHIVERRCPALVCKEPIAYYILPDKCYKGCDHCVLSCPVEAITTDEKRGIKIIDQTKCTKCGSCILVCPPEYNAIVKLSPPSLVPQDK